MALARAWEEWPSGPESSLPNLRVGDDRWCLEHGKWHAETLLFPPPKSTSTPHVASRGLEGPPAVSRLLGQQLGRSAGRRSTLAA